MESTRGFTLGNCDNGDDDDGDEVSLGDEDVFMKMAYSSSKRVSFEKGDEDNREDSGYILSKRRSMGKRSAIVSSSSLMGYLASDFEDTDGDDEDALEKSIRDLMDYTKYERTKDWLNSLRRLDPRWQIKVFFNECARAGVSNIEERGISAMDLSPLLKYFTKNQVFTVWRPTSNESIRKMMTGEAVGKGLGIKGKSAKTGLLSAYVPFLQIHSDDSHKNRIATLLKDARIRVFFRTQNERAAAIAELEKICAEMIKTVKKAVVTIHKQGEVSDDIFEEALTNMKLQMTDPTILVVNDNAPQSYGIDIPERLFWEAFVVRKDITRTPGSPMDTGRPSEPAFQDMNFATTRKPKKYDPKAVVFQYGGHTDNDPLCPLTLLMAYEENGRVCPVASDFDGFLMGTKSAGYGEALPPQQIEVLKRTVSQIGEILDDATTRKSSWTTNWLNILKKNTIDGVKPNMPQYGYGDPKTYCIMENAIGRLETNGAVRHGSECFNYYFPQELDDQFLVISDNFQDGSPWKYLNVVQLQEFLCDQIERGFTFPLNPKWVMCDPGWGAVYDKLLASQKPNVQDSIDAWLPPNSGIREKIHDIRQRHPRGFVRERQALDNKSISSSGFEKDSTHAMDLATLQLKRYLALQRAKRKLRIVLLFLRITQTPDETPEDKRLKFMRLSLNKSLTQEECEPTNNELTRMSTITRGTSIYKSSMSTLQTTGICEKNESEMEAIAAESQSIEIKLSQIDSSNNENEEEESLDTKIPETKEANTLSDNNKKESKISDNNTKKSIIPDNNTKGSMSKEKDNVEVTCTCGSFFRKFGKKTKKSDK